MIFALLNIANNIILFKLYQIFKKEKMKRKMKEYFQKLKIFIFYQQIIFYSSRNTINNYKYLLSGNYSLISDVLLMSNISIFITSSISFYARPFTIISNKFKDALIFQKIKKILIFPILLILLIINYYAGLEKFFVINISILFILYLWRVEADLVLYELQGSKKKLTKNLIEIIFFSYFINH